MPEVELLFLGSGTSAGIPMIGCHCDVCTSADPHDHRTRPSVVISYNDHHVLVDASPELRLQCLANRVERLDAVVFTHGHADHIMGLDDLRRFNTLRAGPLDVWADNLTHQVLTSCFGYAFREPDPTLAVYRPHLIRRYIDAPFEIAGVPWTPIRLFHGDMPILGFRVGQLAYCTDVSRIPDESFPLLENLDLLVLDGLQFKKHPTHFNIDEALAAAHRLRPKRTYLTHIAHGVSHAKTSPLLPPTIHLAHDTLRLRSSL